MRISIYQPSYLPWLPYIDKMKNCDIFVYLNNVAYSKNSFDNRNKILIDGKDHWLTIPIKTAGKSGQKYTETIPANYDFLKNHIQIIEQTYKKEKFFDKYFPRFKKMYDDGYDTSLAASTKAFDIDGPSLSEICWWMLGWYESVFNTKCSVVKASTRHYEGVGSDLILNICRQWKADEYYSGQMGHDYLDEEKFKKAGIKIVYQDYEPPNHYAAIHQLFINGPIL